MKIEAIYTIKTTYEFDNKELLAQREYPDEEALKIGIRWIKENFIPITTRADNVLPFDYDVDIQFEEKE